MCTSLLKAFVKNCISVKQNTPCQRLLKAAYLNDVGRCPKFNSRHGTVSILISTDVPELFCTKTCKRKTPRAFVAVETQVNWSLLESFLSPSYTINFG